MTTIDLCWLAMGASCIALALLVALAMAARRRAWRRDEDEQRRRKLPVIEHYGQ